MRTDTWAVLGQCKRRSGFVIYCLLFFLLGTGVDAAEDSVMVLKELMSNTVAVKSIVFEQTSPKSSHRTSYFGRWDQGNFLLASIKSNPDDPIDLHSTNIALAVGRDKDVFWTHDSSKYLTVWTNSGPSIGQFEPKLSLSVSNRSGIYGSTANHTILLRNLLLQTLHFGIGMLDPNTIKWDGLHFEGANTMGSRIEGELAVENGCPSLLRYKCSEFPVEFFISMDYQKPFPFPSHMTLDMFKDGKKTLLTEINIFSFEAISSPLPDDLFDPGILLTGDTVIEINHEFYWSPGKDRPLIKLQLHHPAARLSKRHNKFWVTAILIALISLPALYFAKYARHNTGHVNQ